MTYVKRIPDGKEIGENDNISYSYKEALAHKICNLSPFLPKTFKVEIKNEGHNLTIEMEKLEKRLRDPSDENKIKSWKNVLQAVALLNYFGIAHRDIKDENIMYRNGEEAVLIDFGLSKPLMGGFHTPSVVSDFYRAPELDKELDVQKYSFEIDSWSLGIWALEMWNPDFDAIKFVAIWKAAYKNNKKEEIEKFIENVPSKLQKVVRSFLLPSGQRKTAGDWVKIDDKKFLFSYPEELDIRIPAEYAEWSHGYKSIYFAILTYYSADKKITDNTNLLHAMTIWACSLLVLPYDIDIEDIAKKYKTTSTIIYSKVLEWFTHWKVTTRK